VAKVHPAAILKLLTSLELLTPPCNPRNNNSKSDVKSFLSPKDVAVFCVPSACTAAD
jgi:hypothetical protein